MKKALAIMLMLALAGSAFAGTVTFDGQSAALGATPRIVYHWLINSATQYTTGTADGYVVTHVGGIVGLYLSETGGNTVNSDLFTVSADKPYTMITTLKIQNLETPAVRLGLMATPNTNFSTATDANNRVGFEALTTGNNSYRGSHLGLEFAWNAAKEEADLQDINADPGWWGILADPQIVPSDSPYFETFEFRGDPIKTISQTQDFFTGRPSFTRAELEGKEFGYKVEWKPTRILTGLFTSALGVFEYSVKLEDDPDIGEWTHVYNLAAGEWAAVPYAGQPWIELGAEHVFTYRWRAAVEDMVVTFTGDAIPDQNVYGVPSITAPFFAG